MKNIKVSDEMYEKLIALATEMTTQDPRATRMPHIFQIRTTEEVAAPEGCGEEFWFDEEGTKLDTDKEIKEAIINIKKWNNEDDEEVDRLFNDLDEEEIDDLLLQNNYFKMSIQNEYKYQNCFLTAKACQEHIKANNYHYNKPVDYLNHAWRNPEMELVSEFLCGLVGKKMHT